MESLDKLLEKIKTPLFFAAGLDVERLVLVKNLETAMSALLKKFQEAVEQEAPSEKKNEMSKNSLLLSNRFKEYARLDPLQKKALLEEGLCFVSEMKAAVKKNGGIRKEEDRPTGPKDARNDPRLLSQSVRNAKGVGPKIADLLARKKILSLEDLLYFVPRRYEDRRTVHMISETCPGKRQTVVGRISTADMRHYGKRRIFEVAVEDGHGSLKAKWFKGREAFLRGSFKPGRRVILTGEVSGSPFEKEMLHPDFEMIEEGEDQLLNFKRIVPVYSETEGLHQKIIRRILWRVVRDFVHLVRSPIPEEICQKRHLMEIAEAIREVHFPAADQEFASFLGARSDAHQRLIYDEFFFFQLGIAFRRRGSGPENGIAFQKGGELLKKFYEAIPFALTAAQRRVVSEIETDMASVKSMNRLLQGDVGSGKTVVSFAGMVIACENGYQAALMAPTEILAEQHHERLKDLCHRLGLKVVLLTGSLKDMEKKELQDRIENGDVDIVVGTHALIQEGISFRRLGLVVIDEQHRFGVIQRGSLRKKGSAPDVLVMTATPIPRTLAMTVYGDLDVSVIDEMPPGKTPVRTKIGSEKQRAGLYNLIRREIAKGHQVFIVYPLVEESENLDLKDATRMTEHLQKEIFPDFKVGLVHGRMKGIQKEQVMGEFRRNNIQILVSTTVVEVGIDVPAASVMVVEHAERFGLSQLHQLRGRVGRSDIPSLCVLMTQSDVSGTAKKRLKIMEETNDGFKIAEEDLAIRGPGEFMGTRQSGLPDFRVADILRDIRLLTDARADALALLSKDPRLENPEHALLKEELLRRWSGRLEIAKTG